MAFVQFQFRRGTAAEWLAANPILAEGEMGIETDTYKYKIGNGTDTWTTLAYDGLGDSGFSGYSGLGVSGFSGYSSPGTSGFSGFSAASPGASGFSGFSGYSGKSGYSGFSGTGESGFSGFSGPGQSGFSGYSSYSGYSGPSGYSGFSSFSGLSGFSGPSGYSAYSGFSGVGFSGFSGFSGVSAYSGYSGFSAFSGFSSFSGYSGISGFSPFSGFSGFSGFIGVSGFSGYSGWSGAGFSGYSGYSSFSGYSSYSGYSAFSGFSGPSLLTFSTQTDVDYTLVLGDLNTGVKMSSTAAHNLTIPLNATVAFPIGAQIVIEQGNTGIVTIVATGGVTLQGGTATNGQYSTVVLTKQATDTWLANVSGVSGFSGFSGPSGYSGFSAYSGISGYSADSGISGYSGFSGFSGSGFSGYSAFSGFSGLPSSAEPFTFSANTTDSDPGSGFLRFNNATFASITQIYVDNNNQNGDSVTAWLDSFDDSSNPVKGTITTWSGSAGAAFGIFNVTGSVVDGTGYRKITVTPIAQNGAVVTQGFKMMMSFTRAGESGYSGYSGFSGYSSFSGYSGQSGYSGYSAFSGFSGGGAVYANATGEAFTSTTLANVAGLTFPLVTGTYVFETYLFGQSSSSAGVKMGINYTGTYTSGDYQTSGLTTSGTVQAAPERGTANNTATTLTYMTVATTEQWMYMSGRIVTGGSGTFTIQALKVTSGTFTIRASSWAMVAKTA